jgi:hypothetical protein
MLLLYPMMISKTFTDYYSGRQKDGVDDIMKKGEERNNCKHTIEGRNQTLSLLLPVPSPLKF